MVAEDGAISARPLHKPVGTPNRDTAVVSITVSDVNDNAPFFESPLYTAEVFENAEPGTPAITVVANDNDESKLEKRSKPIVKGK